VFAIRHECSGATVGQNPVKDGTKPTKAGQAAPHAKTSRRWRWLRNLVLLLIAVPLASLVLSAYVFVATFPFRYSDAARAPEEPVAVVFGAGIYGRDQPTPMLADRVQTAVWLYRQGRARKILMTGDSSRITHDEVTTMQDYATARGVAAQDIALDYAGFSTYESCYRARAIFGITRAVLVTQAYHLPRALYTCRALGIDAVGVGTPDWGVYSDGLMAAYTAREVPAILKALWDVHIAHPLPTFLGPYEGWRLKQS
jgi:vancomycin permeability regulator SanA